MITISHAISQVQAFNTAIGYPEVDAIAAQIHPACTFTWPTDLPADLHAALTNLPETKEARRAECLHTHDYTDLVVRRVLASQAAAAQARWYTDHVLADKLTPTAAIQARRRRRRWIFLGQPETASLHTHCWPGQTPPQRSTELKDPLGAKPNSGNSPDAYALHLILVAPQCQTVATHAYYAPKSYTISNLYEALIALINTHLWQLLPIRNLPPNKPTHPPTGNNEQAQPEQETAGREPEPLENTVTF